MITMLLLLMTTMNTALHYIRARTERLQYTTTGEETKLRNQCIRKQMTYKRVVIIPVSVS